MSRIASTAIFFRFPPPQRVTVVRLFLHLILCLVTLIAQAETKTSHGIARFDNLKYPDSFQHFEYVNPNAPKGGAIRLFTQGTFDSMNPYAAHGITLSSHPSYHYMRYGFTELNEPLMVGTGSYAPSGDELKSAYGLIAHKAEYPDDNQWIIFHLRPEARFHDQHPITSEDVVFTFHELLNHGHPKYQMQLEAIESVTAQGKHKVKFQFKQSGDRSQLLRAAEMPVLPAHYWKDRELSKTTLTPPLNSGPYKVTQVKPGVSVTLSRVQDYWGKDLPVNRGKYNFDTVIVYFHRDLNAALEAFKAGGHDIHVEIIAKNWNNAYDFSAIRDEKVKRLELPHKLPFGSTFFFFNTRRPLFQDVRVRQALVQLFDYEWTSRVIFHNSYLRADSYFANSRYQATGIPSRQEQALLTPFAKHLPEELFKHSFSNPVTSGDGNIRPQRKRALELLKSAGWNLKAGQLVHQNTGKTFSFDFLYPNNSSDRYLLPYKKNLESIGIQMTCTTLDTSQYYQRLRARDFDMIEHLLPQSQSPGQELENYFHSSQIDNDSSMNLAGINHPAIDGLLARLPEIKNQQELDSLLQSLDRVLLWNHYGVPKWYTHNIRIAYWDKYDWPKAPALYTTPFSTWWQKSASTADTRK